MKRILTAVVLIALVVALLFFGKLWMVILLSAGVAALAPGIAGEISPSRAQRPGLPAREYGDAARHEHRRSGHEPER